MGGTVIRWFTRWLAARQGLELHYRPRRDPPIEPVGTLANDGTPCARPPSRPTRYEAGPLERQLRRRAERDQ
jgi:hypothetical protein